MSDVNKEQARREAVENVGNRPPTEGENRVQAAMRRYLGAEVFHEVHPPRRPGQGRGEGQEAGRGGPGARRRVRGPGLSRAGAAPAPGGSLPA